MTTHANGETDDPKGNTTVKNSQNKDGGRDEKPEANQPNMTGATAPQPGDTGNQNENKSDEQESSEQ